MLGHVPTLSHIVQNVIFIFLLHARYVHHMNVPFLSFVSSPSLRLSFAQVSTGFTSPVIAGMTSNRLAQNTNADTNAATVIKLGSLHKRSSTN